jgi:hypothetical protein
MASTLDIVFSSETPGSPLTARGEAGVPSSLPQASGTASGRVSVAAIATLPNADVLLPGIRRAG